MDNNSIELTKEDEMNILHDLNQKNIKQNKFPMLIPTMTKIIKRKKNSNPRIDSKLKKNQLLIDYNKTSLNINNFRRNLPKIMTSYTPIEKRHKYSNNFKNKNNKENKTFNLSRNFDISLLNNCNSDNNNFLGNNNNYDNNNNHYLTRNNINSINKNNKIKFDMNKKNLMNKMKHPSKINYNINKKNLKYKIPIDMINNFNFKKKQKYNNNDISNESPKNNRTLNLRQNNNNEYTNLHSNLNKKKEFNIESTLMTYNNLVSQAKELGHILIDNKDLLKNQNYNLIENEEYTDDYILSNNIDMKSEINKLNQEIKNEYKGVQELQKINSELNNKIILFNDNAKQYEKKVDELISVITQVKNNNNNNTSNNNSDNISNGISNNNNSNIFRKSSNNNFSIEKVPKKKKIKFGFVELIFMKDDKFEIIQKLPPPKYEQSENKNFFIKKSEPKLVFVNMNKNDNNGNNIIKFKATNEDYLDAASQIANQIIIESLISLKNE